METIYIVILFIIFVILIKIITDNNENFINLDKSDNTVDIALKDHKYFQKFSKSNVISKLYNNNQLKTPIVKKNKILFITYDNRAKEQYVRIHNANINKYALKYDYEYKFINKCNDNVYWCKIFLVLNELLKNKYDYVVWLDSDTIIKNFDIDIGNIFNLYSSDIFVGSDNNPKFDIINSGVFAIKNSLVGIKFLEDCIQNINDKCYNSNGTLKGRWAASCYEQGVMNLVIADLYYKFTTVLSNNIFFNYNVCSDQVFIMHLYASSPSYRVKCFNSKNPAL